MSLGTRAWDPSDDLNERVGEPPSFSMPAPHELTGSTAWERAQTESDSGGPINDAERMVVLSGSE